MTRFVTPGGVSRRPASLRRVLVAIALGCLCAAPTPGDIGGCGQQAELLDPPIFFASKAYLDCIRCGECGLETQFCDNACDPAVPTPLAFPQGCFPLVHDGEVCLRALRYASCDDYAGYVSDSAPSVPSECNFCPE
jgi:hypothetical protein